MGWIPSALAGVSNWFGQQDALKRNENALSQSLGLKGFDQETGRLGGGLYDRVMGGSDLALNQWNAGSAYTQNRLGLQTGLTQRTYGNLRGGVNSGYGALNEQTGKGYRSYERGLNNDYMGVGRNVGSASDRLTSSVVGGYGARRNRALAMQSRLGIAEGIDIGEGYRKLGASQNANLASRGLSGTTIGANLAQGRQREKTLDMGRLSERLRSERIGLDTRLSGDALSAQERMGSAGIDRRLGIDTARLGARGRAGMGRLAAGERIGSQQLGADERLGLTGAQSALRAYGDEINFGSGANDRRYDMRMGRLGLDQSLVGGITGTIEGVDYPYPQGGLFDPYLQYQGARASRPSSGGSGGLLGQLGGSAIGAAGSIAAAKIFMACIDSEAGISTPDGHKPLREVEVGSTVLNADGEPKTVVLKDHGRPHAERFDDYVRLTKDGRSLVVTTDHVVDGRPAGEWDSDPDATVEKAGHVPSGDLLLEDGSDYIANGFRVKSMLTKDSLQPKE